MLKISFNKYRNLPVQIKATFWFLICSMLQKGISTLTTPIFTRLLTTDEYGSYSVFNSWMSIIFAIVTLSLTSGVSMTGLIKFSHDRNVFSSSLQGLMTTLIVFWTVIYVLFHDFWNQLFSLTTLQMSALLIIVWTTAVFDLWACKQRVQFSYKRLVILSVIISIAKPFVGIFFVLHAEDKVTAWILSIAFVQLIGYTGLFAFQLNKGRKFYNGYFWKYAVLYSLPLIPQALAEIVLNCSDRIMIGKLIGDSEAGIYNLAYAISLIMTIFSTAIQQTMSPWIYQKIKDRRIEDISSVATFSLGIIATVNLVLIGIAPEAVHFFAPESYYEAIWIIPPISMSVVAMFLCNLFAKLEFYYEKTYFVMIASLMAAVVNIILNYVFISRYGYFAAAYTTLICYFADAIGHYLFMRNICKKYLSGEHIYNMKKICGITLYFLLFGLGFMLLYSNLIVRYALLILSGFVILLLRKQIIKRIKLALFHGKG